MPLVVLAAPRMSATCAVEPAPPPGETYSFRLNARLGRGRLRSQSDQKRRGGDTGVRTNFASRMVCESGEASERRQEHPYVGPMLVLWSIFELSETRPGPTGQLRQENEV